ncbi:hypothetical protein JYU34_003943 [Plutella xylostella]|uniref:Uncharacterized protein n=1 Tax=Plutella xylostella TaxID=51655 RepID=A0ABQ7R1D7_PLUXY|nr:hypothetical protein JYU34_003943 [Plutella xylostella]
MRHITIRQLYNSHANQASVMGNWRQNGPAGAAGVRQVSIAGGWRRANPAMTRRSCKRGVLLSSHRVQRHK